nr:S24 family peptidase [Methylobacterium sp. L1A1]
MAYAPLTPEWLKESFERTGRKQAELVAYLRQEGIDIDATKVSKTVKGLRQVQSNELMPIWKFFGNKPEDLLTAMTQSLPSVIAAQIEQDAMIRNMGRSLGLPDPNAGLPERIRTASGGLPIFGVSVGGNARRGTLFNGQKLGEVARPMSLANNYRAYATYVHGDSMEPRYEAGEIVLVNPEKGYRKGNYVVAQVYDNDGDPPFGYVKRFVSFGEELVLEQLNPPAEEERFMRFPKQQVVSVHRIVGTLDE